MFEALLQTSTGNLVASLMPSTLYGVAPERRQVIEQNAIKLSSRRLHRLPKATRVAIGVLAILFNVSAIATIGKPLSRASYAERKRHLDKATKFPAIPFKDLVRLYRALVLLSVYNDPEVRSQIGYPVPDSLKFRYDTLEHGR